MYRTRLKYYFQGDRLCQLLAWKLKQNEAKCSINAIRNNEGDIVSEPKEISQVFYDFYKSLSTYDNPVDMHKCKTFFNSITLPKLQLADIDFLEDPLSLEELKISVKSLQKGVRPWGR